MTKGVILLKIYTLGLAIWTLWTIRYGEVDIC